jgi:hypothetical protein
LKKDRGPIKRINKIDHQADVNLEFLVREHMAILGLSIKQNESTWTAKLCYLGLMAIGAHNYSQSKSQNCEPRDSARDFIRNLRRGWWFAEAHKVFDCRTVVECHDTF